MLQMQRSRPAPERPHTLKNGIIPKPCICGFIKLHPRLSINLSTLADLYLSFFTYIILPYLIDFLHHSLSICYIVIRPYLILAFLSRIFYQCISFLSSYTYHLHDHATGTAGTMIMPQELHNRNIYIYLLMIIYHNIIIKMKTNLNYPKNIAP